MSLDLNFGVFSCLASIHGTHLKSRNDSTSSNDHQPIHESLFMAEDDWFLDGTNIISQSPNGDVLLEVVERFQSEHQPKYKWSSWDSSKEAKRNFHKLDIKDLSSYETSQSTIETACDLIYCTLERMDSLRNVVLRFDSQCPSIAGFTVEWLEVMKSEFKSANVENIFYPTLGSYHESQKIFSVLYTVPQIKADLFCMSGCFDQQLVFPEKSLNQPLFYNPAFADSISQAYLLNSSNSKYNCYQFEFNNLKRNCYNLTTSIDTEKLYDGTMQKIFYLDESNEYQAADVPAWKYDEQEIYDDLCKRSMTYLRKGDHLFNNDFSRECIENLKSMM